MKKLIYLVLFFLGISTVAFADHHSHRSFENKSTSDIYSIDVSDGTADFSIPNGKESNLASCEDNHHCKIPPGGVVDIDYNANDVDWYEGAIMIKSENPGSSDKVQVQWGTFKRPDLIAINTQNKLLARLKLNDDGHGNIVAIPDYAANSAASDNSDGTTERDN